MRNTLGVTLAALLCAASISSAADAVTRVVDPYLRIQDALANDSMEGVKELADAIAGAAAELGPDGSSLKSSAAELKAAAGLPAARAAFWKVTDALIGYAEKTRASFGETNKLAYCPMEKKYWVQKTGPIENPYGGRKMLRCGEFVTGRTK